MAKLKLNIKKPSEQAAGNGNTVTQGTEITAPIISLPESGGIRIIRDSESLVAPNSIGVRIILKNAKIHAEKVIIKKVEK